MHTKTQGDPIMSDTDRKKNIFHWGTFLLGVAGLN